MIRLTLQRRLFLAIFALAAVLVAVLVFAMRWNLGESFGRYTSAAEFARLDWMIDNIEKEYAAQGSWDFLRTDTERKWRRLSRPNQRGGSPPRNDDPPPDADERSPLPPRPQPPPPPWEMRPSAPPPPGGPGGPGGPGDVRPAPSNDLLRIGPRLSLLNAEGKVIAGNADIGGAKTERPIIHNGRTVGKLVLQAAPSSVQQLDAAFLASQTHYMLLAAAAALGLSLLAAGWLTRHLLAPIRDVTAGARSIAAGSLDARIPVRHDDELGELADNFNVMAERLARIEESRRAWISDTSHELRTPLAVLRAEIEALQDGVRTADAATLARLHRQVDQLTTLVNDLRQTLHQDAAGKPMEHLPFPPLEILQEVLAAFDDRFAAAGIVIESVGLDAAGIILRGDAGRLFQVFSNLLENTLRYTDAGGRLHIRAGRKGSRLVLRFDDTAPAPPRATLARLFERFFRAEPSRSRAHGGSGLGLAICKALVEAHGGTITANLSELGGLAIRIELPLEKT